ncbi:MAG TPA: hypothetical protein VMG12_25560, partial [Polyangiaceae bacterium]|nr:hypothetical protein [Polyangiaceae bacterium]
SSSSYTTSKGLVVIDATDPAAPKLVSNVENAVTTNNNVNPGNSPWNAFSGYYNYGFTGPQVSTVRSDKALVQLEQRWIYNNSVGGSSTTEIRLNVYDLSDPAKPTQKFLPVPKADGYAGLVRDGADVLFSHFEQSQDGARARFFIDRIDLTDPKNPKITDKINVPGALLHLDRPHGRALTSELTRNVVKGLTSKECYERFGHAEWQQDGSADGGYVPYSETSKGTCTGYTEHLHMVRFVTGGAVLDSSYHLADSERISSSSLGDGRVTAVLNHGYGGGHYPGPWIGVVDCWDCGRGGGISIGGVSKPAEILVLGGLASDEGVFEVGRLKVEESEAQGWWGFWGSPPVYASGMRALVRSSSDAAIIDTSVASDPKIVRRVPLYGSAGDLQAAGNLVLLSLGMNGVQRIDL